VCASPMHFSSHIFFFSSFKGYLGPPNGGFDIAFPTRRRVEHYIRLPVFAYGRPYFSRPCFASLVCQSRMKLGVGLVAPPIPRIPKFFPGCADWDFFLSRSGLPITPLFAQRRPSLRSLFWTGEELASAAPHPVPFRAVMVVFSSPKPSRFTLCAVPIGLEPRNCSYAFFPFCVPGPLSSPSSFLFLILVSDLALPLQTPPPNLLNPPLST